MSKQTSNKKTTINREQRRMRLTRIVFVIISVILILSWILTLVVQ